MHPPQVNTTVVAAMLAGVSVSTVVLAAAVLAGYAWTAVLASRLRRLRHQVRPLVYTTPPPITAQRLRNGRTRVHYQHTRRATTNPTTTAASTAPLPDPPDTEPSVLDHRVHTRELLVRESDPRRQPPVAATEVTAPLTIIHHNPHP